jgi:two-component system, NarL family, sensor histidine kinase DegS
MSTTSPNLTQQYAAGLTSYLAHGDEAGLHRAYELGRRAIAEGLGVMELAAAHEATLTGLLAACGEPQDHLSTCRRAATFFSESLWPFEMMQRGFSEANRNLRDLSVTLARRNVELRHANEELGREIVERKRVEQALRHTETQLRTLSQQVLTAQEEERKRISRELHDEVGQALTAINLNLTMLINKDPNQPLAGRLADLQRLLQQTMETIHDFTRELRPAMLDHLGLVPALRAYVRNFQKRTGLRVLLRATTEVESLGMEEKTVLYRVTQEGLTNVAKHAHAHRAAVLIRRAEEVIQMEVRDDGRSFCVEKILGHNNGRKRLGLLGIQERVRLVKGDFCVQSESGKGTIVRVKIPWKIGGVKAN